jgi:hypothetical protein
MNEANDAPQRLHVIVTPDAEVLRPSGRTRGPATGDNNFGFLDLAFQD